METDKNSRPIEGYEQEWSAIASRHGMTSLPDTVKTYGLALSGGGIRSATFSLGVVRALAKKGKFVRYDYLSTVSGGGYLGGMLGRLHDGNQDALAVQAGLAADDSILLSWLRKNGRYLTPAGGRDIALGLTQILRSFFAALTLVTLLSLMFACLALYFTVGEITQVYIPPLNAKWVIAAPLMFAGWLAAQYWFCERWWTTAAIFILGCALISGFLYKVSVLPLCWLAPLLVACWISTGSSLLRKMANPAQVRLQLTQATCRALLIALTLFALYIINVLGNTLYDEYSTDSQGSMRYFLPPALIGILRVLWEFKPIKQLISQFMAKKKKVSLSLTHAGNLLGFVLMAFALVTVFAALVSLLHSVPAPYDSWNRYTPALIAFASALIFLLLCRSKMIIAFLNLSSLHNLYRARIERAWLSVANYQGQPGGKGNWRFSRSPLSSRQEKSMDRTKQVTEPVDGDDAEMDKYFPQRDGGPLHLITCCINQTVDDRSGIYNADRKGVALTIGPFGAETGMRPPEADPELTNTSLSRWLAISGAAAATGMGSQTQPGLAFLLFLIGGRLGYWTPKLGGTRQKKPEKKRSYLCYLFAEMYARFPGLTDDFWYLSDGGHFENTAVYPLLKRRVDHIVVTDCGADPDFLFADLENLVRKAKIDMAIDITFLSATHPAFTSITTLKTKRHSPPHLRATISYPQTATLSAKTGELIIIKPHLLDEMSLATASYAERNPDFPQQTTGDQFFDEEQWEAYHQLGLEAGKAIPW